MRPRVLKGLKKHSIVECIPTTTPGVAAKSAATTGVCPTTTPGVAAKGAATTGVYATATPGVAAKGAASFNPGVAGYATPGVEGVE